MIHNIHQYMIILNKQNIDRFDKKFINLLNKWDEEDNKKILETLYVKYEQIDWKA